MDSKTFYIEVGRRIRKCREEAGFTQEALASLISLTRTSITNIEKGRQKLMLHTFYDLAQVLRVSPITLLPEIEDSLIAEESLTSRKLDNELKKRPADEQNWIKAVVQAFEEEKRND